MPEKFGKPKVKIIPPHLWPSLFLTIGVYDVIHDLIFIKGELPRITSRQTLKHENTHRKWFLYHSRIREFYNFLYWKPALYFILSAFFITLYLCSILFWEMGMVLLSATLCLLTLIVFHYGLHEILERPARKASGFLIEGLSAKELLRLVMISLMPAFLLLPTVFAFWILSLENTLIVLGLGFFGIWLYQILHIWAINNLRRHTKLGDVSGVFRGEG